MALNNRPVCGNAAEIATYIGVNKNQIKYLKEKYKLPAFKIDGQGNWKALKVSLDKWLIEMEGNFL